MLSFGKSFPVLNSCSVWNSVNADKCWIQEGVEQAYHLFRFFTPLRHNYNNMNTFKSSRLEYYRPLLCFVCVFLTFIWQLCYKAKFVLMYFWLFLKNGCLSIKAYFLLYFILRLLPFVQIESLNTFGTREDRVARRTQHWLKGREKR